MIDDHDLFERAVERFAPPERSFERLVTRRDRKHRNKRITAGVVAIIVATAGTGLLVRALPTGSMPADDPTPASPTSTPASPTSTPASPTSGTMWPQSSMREVRRAQELADAGDPAYTWQVDPHLTSRESDPLLTDGDLWTYLSSPRAEIIERFLRKELGWEEFVFSGEATSLNAEGLHGLVYLRCAPGEMNPLYRFAPVGKQQVRSGERCAPTIDDLRYEAVRLDLSQPDRRGLDGIWVVSGWTTTRFAQADPSVVEAEATARLTDFLRARIEGMGAEGYVEIFDLFRGNEDVPLLYATTTGAPYERFEIEQPGVPDWPDGDM